MIKTDSIPFYLKLSQISIGIVAFVFAMYIGQEIILPLIFALLIAILLNPFVEFLRRKGLHQVVAILIVILIAFILLAILFYFIITQASLFTEALPQLKVKFKELSETAIIWVSDTFNISTTKIQEWVAKQKGEGLSNSSAIISKTLFTVSGLIFMIFLIPVYVFMFLFYKKLLLQFISRLFAKEKHGMVKEIMSETKSLIQSYLYGLSIEAGLVAILNSVALLIIGVDYAILIGVIGALLNVIPYIGGVVAIGLPMIIAIATQSPAAAAWVFVAYTVVQFIDNQIIVPYIVASKVKINGLISIVVILIGGSLWGVAGMFLSIPLTAIIKVFFDRIEPLKPWGILLGDEVAEPAKDKVSRNKKLLDDVMAKTKSNSVLKKKRPTEKPPK